MRSFFLSLILLPSFFSLLVIICKDASHGLYFLPPFFLLFLLFYFSFPLFHFFFCFIFPFHFLCSLFLSQPSSNPSFSQNYLFKKMHLSCFEDVFLISPYFSPSLSSAGSGFFSFLSFIVLFFFENFLSFFFAISPLSPSLPSLTKLLFISNRSLNTRANSQSFWRGERNGKAFSSSYRTFLQGV